MESSNSSDLSLLMSMGFSIGTAQSALTKNDTVEAAVNWLFENNSLEDSTNNNEDFEVVNEEMKMVMIVRSDLSMTAGKIVAQCIHAALGVYRLVNQINPNAVAIWEASGEKAVCLKCLNEEEMLALETAALDAGLPAHSVIDAGRTQILAGSRTVLAIGPAEISRIDSLTGKLRLY
mmetsp:Transcript_8502/g.8442  ORF Transcript_8502/g.8442 Transcript_8502/m.8442 type:complete len:177 (+) Transcript_8502:207-737(+)|eukprot:CAMPEP_0119038316 /NCGR_PEP_ID=MMETSP1177-20130426/7154_1 /TAXON_ID=2985 /ORGANISM="Ochromonas sp, Strain CCMP1899" /LENGTH=176 /DNA_ID=CAMNT_0007000727 /DNA_START=194 /DNA_END=724 /DNA_ORIENTATION=-